MAQVAMGHGAACRKWTMPGDAAVESFISARDAWYKSKKYQKRDRKKEDKRLVVPEIEEMGHKYGDKFEFALR